MIAATANARVHMSPPLVEDHPSSGGSPLGSGYYDLGGVRIGLNSGRHVGVVCYVDDPFIRSAVTRVVDYLVNVCRLESLFVFGVDHYPIVDFIDPIYVDDVEVHN